MDFGETATSTSPAVLASSSTFLLWPVYRSLILEPLFVCAMVPNLGAFAIQLELS